MAIPASFPFCALLTTMCSLSDGSRACYGRDGCDKIEI